MTVKLYVSEDEPSRKWLQVNGKPFLVKGPELQNSSLSIGQEQIEPEEGKLDFEQLDLSIQAARRHELHLILLWFGTYKNGSSSAWFHQWAATNTCELDASTYTPSWVKTNPIRFVSANAKSFAKLMQHLKQVNQEHSTITMVQVENEPRLLRGSPNYSLLANRAFTSPVPKDLVDCLREDWAVSKTL
ncbi:hypothetical protein Neosp_002200 [[Neocosmospora] mangrovei]